ncbi:ISL3 family transposase [Rhodococcus sp. HM1]|uniref:ISL3 family transposase n=1 Tax=Rhodococcus sp. HM1 TaxID=2937759 RepID=UPI00200B0446|nr:ISL3 family transposase [Rhodococcus sp. HM1]MCK8669783.1 ISL3 family transposase [Rhodococcus sp. HM1]
MTDVVVDAVRLAGSTIRIHAHPHRNQAQCPKCDTSSSRVHSRYRRRPADTAIGARPVVLELTVRRFFCVNTHCTTITFAEQIPGLTKRFARRTTVLDAVLEAIGLALAGRAGARLAARLGIEVGRDTLLRAVRAIPDRPIEQTPILGVDDFAIRRGHHYGTVVVDLTTSRPIDLLPDRTSGTVAAWLQEHPGAEVVCRDRAGAYAEAVRTGAPDAVQVADRWHLWHNLVGAVEDTVVRHRADLRPPPELTDPNATDQHTESNCGTSPSGAEMPDGRLVSRTRERHTAVHQLVSSGMTISAISRELRLDRKTVRRFARARTVDELLTTTRTAGPTLLSEHEPYLRERFAAGCTDAARLTAEITERGYRGSAKTVRRFLQPLRTEHRMRPAPPQAPSVRQVTGWLTCRPDRLTDADSGRLTDILEHSPALTALREHVRGFAQLMTERRGRELADWMNGIDATGSPALRSFAAGLRRDLDAVTAGLTLEHNSGPVEGHVNRIIMWNLGVSSSFACGLVDRGDR